MSWKDMLMDEAARKAKNSLWSSRRYVKEAREEKEKMAERATQVASKSAKDEGISTEEASNLVEESRDSALAEGQKEVVRRQKLAFLFIFISIFFLLITADPTADISCYYDDAGEYVCQP